MKIALFHLIRSDDIDADSDSSNLELDQSFQRLLNEKREMTNKENNPPPNEMHASSAAPEKPLRKDLLRERLIEKMHMDSLNGSSSIYHAVDSSSYTFQNTFSNDEEYAAINRLMADCNIEYDTTAVPNNMLVGVTRPSTIAEESTIRSDFEDNSIGKPSSSQSTASTSSISSVVHVAPLPNVLRELKTEVSLAGNTTDDTLEEIEYVRTDTGLNYVPKKKSQTISETESDDDTEIILIDSSPECSFVTSKNVGHFTSAESYEYSFHTARADITEKSKNNVISTEVEPNNDGTNDVQNNERTQSTADTLSHNVSDKMLAHQHLQSRDVSMANEHEHTTDTWSEMPEFNNTLERIEYMMEQGQKMLKHKGAVPKNSNQNSPAVTTRTPIAFGSGKKATPARKFPMKPSSAVKTDVFKRPEKRIRSPAPTSSKIPKTKSTVLISSASKSQFRHIASPIAAYIKNTPETPFIKTIKPTKDFFGSAYYSKMVKSHDESTASIENYSIKASLPRKFYDAAPQRQVNSSQITD